VIPAEQRENREPPMQSSITCPLRRRKFRSRWRIVYLAALPLALGCTSDHDELSNTLSDVRPFEQLQGTRLGMSVADLMSARPTVVLAPYTGFLDSLSGYRVLFHFQDSHRDDQPPPRHNRLHTVAARLHASDSEVGIEHAEVLRALTATWGQPKNCSVGPGSSHQASEWRRNGITLRLTANWRTTRDSSTDTRTPGAFLETRISLNETSNCT
jgi:hypothetical protein